MIVPSKVIVALLLGALSNIKGDDNLQNIPTNSFIAVEEEVRTKFDMRSTGVLVGCIKSITKQRKLSI